MAKILTTENIQPILAQVKAYTHHVADLVVNGCQVNLTGSHITLDKQTLAYGKPATVNAEIPEGYEITNSEITMGGTTIPFDDDNMNFQVQKATDDINANFTVGQAEIYFKKFRGKQGKEKTLEMWVNLPTNCMYIWGYLQLPDGVTPKAANTTTGKVLGGYGSLGINYLSASNRLGFQIYATMSDNAIRAGSYKLLELYLNFANDVELGDYTMEFVQESAYTGYVNASPNGGITIQQTTNTSTRHTVYPKVKMEVVDANAPDIILSETDTTIPEAENNVKVLLRKAFPANKWTAVCLPFALTAEQVQSAFGEGVQLAQWSLGLDVLTTDVNDKAATAEMPFGKWTDVVDAQYPNLVMPATDLAEVVFDNVNFAPDEDTAQDIWDSGRPKYTTYMRLACQYRQGTPRFTDGQLFLFTEDGLQPITAADTVPAYGCFLEDLMGQTTTDTQISIVVT